MVPVPRNNIGGVERQAPAANGRELLPPHGICVSPATDGKDIDTVNPGSLSSSVNTPP